MSDAGATRRDAQVGRCNAAIPSWDEAIGFIVDSNMQSRSQRRPPSRSGSRGNGRRAAARADGVRISRSASRRSVVCRAANASAWHRCADVHVASRIISPIERTYAECYDCRRKLITAVMRLRSISAGSSTAFDSRDSRTSMLPRSEIQPILRVRRGATRAYDESRSSERLGRHTTTLSTALCQSLTVCNLARVGTSSYVWPVVRIAAKLLLACRHTFGYKLARVSAARCRTTRGLSA